MDLIIKFTGDEAGASAVEYAFLMAFIAVAIAASLTSFSSALTNLFSTFRGRTNHEGSRAASWFDLRFNQSSRRQGSDPGKPAVTPVQFSRGQNSTGYLIEVVRQ